MPQKGHDAGEKVVASNRKARHDYQIFETIECGIVLTGDEVKSLRGGRASLTEAYARVRNGEAWLEGMHVPPYEQGDKRRHLPTRPRKLLLHRREIDKLAAEQQEQRLTLVPLRVYFTHGVREGRDRASAGASVSTRSGRRSRSANRNARSRRRWAAGDSRRAGSAPGRLPSWMDRPTVPRTDEIDPVIDLLAKEAAGYLGGLDDRPVRHPDAESVAARFDVPLPERGDGAEAALRGAARRCRRRPAHLRPEVVPLHHRRGHAGGAGRRLVRDRARPEPRRVDRVAARRAARARLAALAEGALRAATELAAGCSRRVPRWRTSSRSRAPAGGGGCSTASTSTSRACRVFPRCRCSGRVTCTRATSRRSRCSGSGARPCGSSPATRSAGSTPEALERELRALDGAPAIVIASAGEVNAGDFDPLPARWPTSPSATAPGSTSTARSVCSPRCPSAPRISSTGSSAPIPRSPTGTSG